MQPCAVFGSMIITSAGHCPRFRAADGTVSFSEVVAAGNGTVSAPGIAPVIADLAESMDPARYECDEDAGDLISADGSLYGPHVSATDRQALSAGRDPRRGAPRCRRQTGCW